MQVSIVVVLSLFLRSPYHKRQILVKKAVLSKLSFIIAASLESSLAVVVANLLSFVIYISGPSAVLLAAVSF